MTIIIDVSLKSCHIASHKWFPDLLFKLFCGRMLQTLPNYWMQTKIPDGTLTGGFGNLWTFYERDLQHRTSRQTLSCGLKIEFFLSLIHAVTNNRRYLETCNTERLVKLFPVAWRLSFFCHLIHTVTNNRRYLQTCNAQWQVFHTLSTVTWRLVEFAITS